MSKQKIEIFGKTDCPNCTKAKNFCDSKSLDYDYGILDEHFTKEELLEEFPTAKTMPQIRVLEDDKPTNIGGYDELVVWWSENVDVQLASPHHPATDEKVGAGEGTNYKLGDDKYTEAAYIPTQQKTGVELKFMDDETPIAFKIKHEVLLKNTWSQDSEGRPSWDAATWVPVDMDDGLYDYQKLLDDWED